MKSTVEVRNVPPEDLSPCPDFKYCLLANVLMRLAYTGNLGAENPVSLQSALNSCNESASTSDGGRKCGGNKCAAETVRSVYLSEVAHVDTTLSSRNAADH